MKGIVNKEMLHMLHLLVHTRWLQWLGLCLAKAASQKLGVFSRSHMWLRTQAHGPCAVALQINSRKLEEEESQDMNWGHNGMLSLQVAA